MAIYNPVFPKPLPPNDKEAQVARKSSKALASFASTNTDVCFRAKLEGSEEVILRCLPLPSDCCLAF